MGRILILILIHIFADFFLQGSKMSRLKMIKLPYLFEHIGIYTFVFIVLSPLFLGLKPLQGLVFSLINGVLHLAIDYMSGRLKTKYLYVANYKYVLVAAIDQCFHLTILLLTYIYLYSNAMYSTFGLSFN
jgi:hypothetical protein